MKTSHYSNFAGPAFDGSYDAALLRRLGKELAVVYDGTLEKSLPPSLQSLVERLHRAGEGAGTGGAQSGRLPRMEPGQS
jgi:hypothetical protein